MKRRLLLIAWLLAAGLCVFAQGGQPPQRMLYFPDTGRNYAALDPGQEILRRNLLISNQAGGYQVSFDLSFNQQDWSGYALGSRFSSIFNLNGEEGCYIRIRTQSAGPESLSEIIYFLIRGKCYSVYWNKELRRWDLVENACRTY